MVIFRAKPALILTITLFFSGLISYLFWTPNTEAKSISELQIELSLSKPQLISNQIIPPIPETIEHDADKAALGQKLFFDPQLSKTGQVSCESCHLLTKGGTDQKPVSEGIHGRLGELNSPTVFNSVFNASQFWDGRAADLKQQVSSPLFNPNEMGHTGWEDLQGYLNQHYQQDFIKLYGAVNLTGLIDAIAEYEKTLITPNSRFDQYLKGNRKALTETEKQGYQNFQDMGCISCHNGINMGGNLYQKAGVFDPISPETSQKWLGRFNVTGNPADKFYLKVPSLRNIAHTAPYFHDGSVATLDQAVKIMAKHQLGIIATETEVAQIVAFLKTLTGQYQGHYIGTPY